jgi:hypothetical protein
MLAQFTSQKKILLVSHFLHKRNDALVIVSYQLRQYVPYSDKER